MSASLNWYQFTGSQWSTFTAAEWMSFRAGPRTAVGRWASVVHQAFIAGAAGSDVFNPGSIASSSFTSGATAEDIYELQT
jgi:hypothetical protein